MYVFLQLIQHIHVITGNTSPNMIAVFYARPYVRFIEIQSNLRKERTFIERIKTPIGKV